MSDAATRERATKRHWAEPGSRHDRLVTSLKWGLPAAALLLTFVLLLSPFSKRGDVSFILDKKEVAEAPERMRVESARYVGEDTKGQRFEIRAGRAIQQSSDVPVVDIMDMFARLDMTKGPLSISADRGRYDLDAQRIDVVGPVKVSGPDGYRLETRDARIDLKEHSLVGTGRIEGATNLGQFSAGSLGADLDERKLVLSGGARLKIVQGAVR